MTKKSTRHYDGDRLVLEIGETDAKKWRVGFTRPDGKHSTITLGDYPQLSLAEARGRLITYHIKIWVLMLFVQHIICQLPTL